MIRLRTNGRVDRMDAIPAQTPDSSRQSAKCSPGVDPGAAPDLYLVEVLGPGEAAGILEEILAAEGMAGAVEGGSEGKDAVRALLWFEKQDDARSAASRLRRRLEEFAEFAPIMRHCELRTGVTRGREWTEEWKRWFGPVEVSSRLVIKPSWASWEARPGQIVVELDPGMCFGTGRHPTTQGCLRLLDAVRLEFGAGVSFLDAGCGSGILSLAASRLGFAPVVAFDHDGDAVRVSRENALRAGVTVDAFVADVRRFAPARPFRVVAANILAPVLIEAAEALCRCLDWQSTSVLILSGLLTDEAERVEQPFLRSGIRRAAPPYVIENWATLAFSTGPIQLDLGA